jgi:hypothetical protein
VAASGHCKPFLLVQDDVLDKMSKNLDNLKSMGHEIRDEADLHIVCRNPLLDNRRVDTLTSLHAEIVRRAGFRCGQGTG